MLRGLRVLLADTGRDRRGGQQQVALLARGLAARDVRPIVWTPSGSWLAAELTIAGLPVAHGPARMRHDLSIRSARALGHAAWRAEVALVHAHDARSHAAARLARFQGLTHPLIVTRRITRRPRGRWKYGRGVTRYIAISEAVRGVLRRAPVAHVPVDLVPSAVVAPPSGERAWPRHLLAHRDDALILVVTALSQEKGVETVIEAAARLRARGGRARWLVLGTGPLRRPLERAARRAAAPVTFAGCTATPGAYMRSADLMVHTPATEGLGTAVLEALARGLPVVATNVGGLRETVRPGAGTLVPAGDAAAVTAAIEQWLATPAWRAVARRVGPAIAAAYSVERMVRGTLQTYAAALGSAARGTNR